MATIEEVRSKVENYLRQKQLNYEVRNDGTYHVPYGSTVAVVRVLPWNERILVKVFSPVALQITQITPELTRFLATENTNLIFGKFSLDAEQNAVWYEHSLLGDNLDMEELYVTVGAIVTTADNYDEKVCEMAGGKRVADL